MLETVKELIMHYGYWALYGLLAVGIVGLPVPDEILMTFVGYLTSIGWFEYIPALLVSLAGAMSGMLVSYMIGHKVGKPFLWKYGKWARLTPARLEKAEKWFHKYGPLTVCFGYFLPGVRHFSCYLAGMSGMKMGKYFQYAGAGALIWCTLFITLGHYIGKSAFKLIPILHRYIGIGVFLAVAIGCALAVFVFLFRKRVPES